MLWSVLFILIYFVESADSIEAALQSSLSHVQDREVELVGC